MDKYASNHPSHPHSLSRHAGLLVLLGAGLPALVYADIQVDSPAGATQVVQSSLGVPVINIADPNSKGLSHNRFQRFDVDAPGVIFNNALQAGVSQSGGRVDANPNLTRNALAILSEVTGNQPSTLAGAMEVFGGKADVIVANPNGITLNGVRLLNTNGFAASTGRPELADGLYLNVENGSGRVVIGAKGVDTTGLSYFDVVARTVALNGKVGAPGSTAAVQVLTGLNRYQPQERTHTADTTAQAQVPDVAIDGSLAGAMYGRLISLISTESGVGVRHAGLIQSSQDIIIRADGDVALTATGAGLPPENANTATTARGIQAGGALQVTAGGTVTVGSNVQADTLSVVATTLNLNGATLRATGYDPAGAALQLQVDTLNLNGSWRAQDVLSGELLRRDQPLLMKHGKLQVMRTPGRYDQHVSLTSDTRIESAGGIALAVHHLNNDQGFIEDESTVGLHITADTFSNLGIVRTKGALDLTTDALSNRCSGSAAAQALCGGVFSGTAATFWVGALNNSGGLVAGGDLTLILGDRQHTNDTTAAIAAGNDLVIAGPAHSAMVNYGELSARRHAEITLETLRSGPNAMVTASGDLRMGIHGDFTNAGYMAVRGRATLGAHNVTIANGAYMAAGGGITVTASGDITTERDAGLYSRGAVSLTAAGALATAATVISEGDLSLRADRTLANTGNLVSSGNIAISSEGSLRNENGALIYAGQNLVVSSNDTLSNLNHSLLLSDAGLTLNATNAFLNNESVVQGGDVTINADTLLNRSASLIHGLNTLALNAPTFQENSGGSTLKGGDSILVQAPW